jgi:glycosyltransferase involved in cell wall biosynthesis
MRTYTFHYLGMNHLPATATYMSCAYNQKVRKLTRMLANAGHKVYLYGAAHTDIDHPNVEFVPLFTLEDIRDSWGDLATYDKYELGYDHATGFRHDLGSKDKAACTKKFWRQAIHEINRRKQPDHFCLMSMGTHHLPATKQIGLFLTCEPGIGYTGTCTQFKAFESHFLMSYCYGRDKGKNDIPDASFYDRVIPNYFELDDFTYRPKPSGDYLCYVGRVIWRKGVDIAAKVAESLGLRLKVAGQGTDADFKQVGIKDNPRVDYLGVLGAKERDELMGNALVGLVPTRYMEPFGGVAVEFQLTGTPVVTTNFGAFPETVRHGVTGYRADTLRDFVHMAAAAMDLDRGKVRSWATRYACESVYPLFAKWWDDLYEVWLSTERGGRRSRGWNELATVPVGRGTQRSGPPSARSEARQLPRRAASTDCVRSS